MADDKQKSKTKIDLKARLGRTTATNLQAPPPPSSIPGAPTAPPPSSEPGSMPMPAAPASQPAVAPSVVPPVGIAPPPGLSPGIPIPPFGQPQRQAPRAEPKPSAAQQTIKVEMSEEIHAERSKWKARIGMGAAAGVLIGGIIGFVGGGSKEKGDRARAGARGAAALELDVKGTVDKLKDMDGKVTEALEKLKGKKYPAELSEALKGLTIPFDAANLDGKDVGFLPPRILKNVIAFTTGAEALNKAREQLGGMVGNKEIGDQIAKAWKEEETPMANFSVVFRTEGKNVVAELLPNVKPFEWKGTYDENYKVQRGAGAANEKSAKRYQKGDLPGNDLVAIPVDPKTTPNPAATAALLQLRKRMVDMHNDLNGNKENPTAETPGLVKIAEDLVNELHKYALASLSPQELGEIQAKKK